MLIFTALNLHILPYKANCDTFTAQQSASESTKSVVTLKSEKHLETLWKPSYSDTTTTVVWLVSKATFFVVQAYIAYRLERV